MRTVHIPAGRYSFADLRRFMDESGGGGVRLYLGNAAEFIGLPDDESAFLYMPSGLEFKPAKKQKARQATPFWANDWRRKSC